MFSQWVGLRENLDRKPWCSVNKPIDLGYSKWIKTATYHDLAASHFYWQKPTGLLLVTHLRKGSPGPEPGHAGRMVGWPLERHLHTAFPRAIQGKAQRALPAPRRRDKMFQTGENWGRELFMNSLLRIGGFENLSRYPSWLVVWLPFFIFPYIGLLIIPIDFHIFQRGGPTANQKVNSAFSGFG